MAATGAATGLGAVGGEGALGDGGGVVVGVNGVSGVKDMGDPAAGGPEGVVVALAGGDVGEV